MKMRKENTESLQDKTKQKSFEDDDNESIESVSDDEFDKYLGKKKNLKFFLKNQISRLDQFMGDIDKDEIDLDEDEKEDIARFV